MENEQNKTEVRKYWFFGSKLNTGLLLVLIVLMVVALMWMSKDREKYFSSLGGDKEVVEEQKEVEEKDETIKPQVKDTYTYTNHGFSIELPKGFVPQTLGKSSNTTEIGLPGINLAYVNNASQLEPSKMRGYEYIEDIKIGETIFKYYTYDNTDTIQNIYWFRKGDVGYEFEGDPEILKTFKFVGWPQMEGNTEDLTSFSIKPGQEVSGKVKVTGVLPARYFFEATCGISILDSNKKFVKNFLCQSSDQDWMERKTTNFYSDLDFTYLPKGNAYIKIEQDDPRGESGMGEYTVRSVLIPIVVK